ncbi:MAG: hypothetical protein ACTHMS_07000 [Jatrophihabitans sp.]|uniref:hypothetical protein n=1 Tax=Jatrophihabitans sp. TaxID=1932789 RepID=UPI003F80808D
MSEMHGRDLVRRRSALLLLLALPLSFYLAVAHQGRSAIPAGAIGMAFAVSGATLFSAVSSLAVDQRLVLCGYRPVELMLGRLLFLAPLGAGVAVGFATVMALLSHPARPWLLPAAAIVVAVQSVPFGLAVAALVPRELEGTLVVIGVVGLQMATRGSGVVAGLLPFHGPWRIVDAAVDGHGPVLAPLVETLSYGIALFVLARLAVGRRLVVHRPDRVPSAGLARSDGPL